MPSSQTCRIVGGLGFLCVLASAVAAEPPEMARFTCELRKKEDTFQVVAPKPGAEAFRIRSASGIGGATITCREGMWPESVAVLFVGMNNLEGFSVAGNGVTLAGHWRQGLKAAIFHFNARGESLPDEKGSAYRLTIEPCQDEGMRVTLATPPAARTAKTWALSWIDAYRR